MVKRKRGYLAIAASMTLALAMVPAVPGYASSPVTVKGYGSLELAAGGATYNGTVSGELANANTDIDVKAEIVGPDEIQYYVDIKWGAMEFKYDYGGSWNPNTHTYGLGPSGKQGGGWVGKDSITGKNYLEGYKDTEDGNNQITVTNNSNFPMTVELSTEVTNGVFNTDNTLTGSVIGLLSTANSDFADSSGEPTQLLDLGNAQTGRGRTTLTMELEMNAASVPSGQTFYYIAEEAKSETEAKSKGTAYFAFAGKPDAGKATSMTSAAKIHVVVSPYQGANKKTVP